MRKIIGMLGAKGSGKDTCASFMTAELGFVRASFAETLYMEVANSYATTVEFLNKRENKERNFPLLKLANCKDERFVEVALQSLSNSQAVRKAALTYYKTGKVPVHGSARVIKGLVQAPRSPRWTLQLWGTEYRRKSKYGVDAYWLDKVKAQIQANPGTSFVITDVRFKNEAQLISTMGGKLFRVRRAEIEAKEARERQAKGFAAHPSETELLGWPVDQEFINEENDLMGLRAQVLSALEPRYAKAA